MTRFILPLALCSFLGCLHPAPNPVSQYPSRLEFLGKTAIKFREQGGKKSNFAQYKEEDKRSDDRGWQFAIEYEKTDDTPQSRSQQMQRVYQRMAENRKDAMGKAMLFEHRERGLYITEAFLHDGDVEFHFIHVYRKADDGLGCYRFSRVDPTTCQGCEQKRVEQLILEGESNRNRYFSELFRVDLPMPRPN